MYLKIFVVTSLISTLLITVIAYIKPYQNFQPQLIRQRIKL